MSGTVLTADAVAGRGVPVTRSLRDWLVRAAFVAQTRTSSAERRRYEQWAFHLIDDAARSSGGVDSVNWARTSPVMPPNVPEYGDGDFIASAPTPKQSTTTAEVRVPSVSSSSSARQAIYRETLTRAPVELHEFILKAFDLYDGEVAQRKRSYEQVTFIEMLNIAKNLQRLSNRQKQQSIQCAPTVVHTHTEQLSAQPAMSSTRSLAHTPGMCSDRGRARKKCMYGGNNNRVELDKNTVDGKSNGSNNTLFERSVGASPSQARAAAQRPCASEGFRAPCSGQSAFEVASFFQTDPRHIVDAPARASTRPDGRAPRGGEREGLHATGVQAPPQTFFSVVPKMGSECGEERSFFTQLSLGNRSGAADASKTAHTAVGRSTELERLYSRYEPNMDDIRPLPVLIRAFAYIQQRASEKESLDGRSAGRKYLSDQLKGMRQDLHVQSLVNNFTVSVYECHARLCLATRELGEFNQCQAALKNMYDDARIDDAGRSHMDEFFYYRLAYLWLSDQHDALSTELISFTSTHLRSAGPSQKQHQQQQQQPSQTVSVRPTRAGVQRTLRLCAACDTGDCATAVQILSCYPREMQLLLNIYLQRLRVRWLREVLCAMRGAMSIRFIMSSLGFTPVHVLRSDDAGLADKRDCAGKYEESASKGPRRKKTSLARDAETGTLAARIASSSTSNDKCTGDGVTLHWLDGSCEEACRAFEELFALLKIDMPVNFSFTTELARDTSRSVSGATHSSPSNAHVASLDAATAMKLVQQYVDYLGTRKDATLS